MIIVHGENPLHAVAKVDRVNRLDCWSPNRSVSFLEYNPGKFFKLDMLVDQF